MHYLVRLYDNVIDGFQAAGGRINGYLAGDEEHIAGQNGLAIGADGGGGIGGGYDLFFHTACKVRLCYICNMKIAGIAGKTRVKEWLSDKLPSRWECVWVDDVSDLDQHRDADLFMDLAFTADEDRIRQLSRLLPAPVMINSVTHTLQEIGRPFIRINAWPGMLERNIHELVMTDLPHEILSIFYKQLDLSYRIVPDVAGMISGRILAMIINEAYYTLQEDVSTKEEIDTAMKLGTNYPFGPFEWGEKIGLENIYDLLNKLSRIDSRYTPAPAMKEAMSILKYD